MGVKIKHKPGGVEKESKKTKVALPGGDLVETAIGEASVKHKDGAMESSTEEIAAVTGKGPFANVGVRASRTINLGDYNSVKIEVSVYIPSTCDEESLNDTYKFGKEWVDEKMTALAEEYGAGNG